MSSKNLRRRHQASNPQRRRTGKARGMRFETLERREVLAAITGSTAPGGFEALSSGGLLYWLNPSTVAQADNTPVAVWTNSGAAGNNFAQANAIEQPLYQTAALGPYNLPALRFDGDTANATSTGTPQADELVLGSSTNPATVFLVNSTSSTNSISGIWGQENGDNGIRRISTSAWSHPGNSNDFTSPGTLYVNGTAGTNPAAPLNTLHLLSAVRPSSVTFPATSLGDYFQSGTNGGRPWGGLLGDVLAFNRSLTRAERIVVENSLAAKYGISVANDFFAGDAAGYAQDVFGILGSGALTNVALGKPATQTSSHGDFPASNGVNGNLGDFTHTLNSDANPHWQVDLGNSVPIEQIVLHNRDSCCQGRLRDITVQVLDANSSVVYTSPLLNPGNTLNGPETITINPGATGRFVRVSRTPDMVGSTDDQRVLSLGEVQVFTTFGASGESVNSAGSAGFGIEAVTGTLEVLDEAVFAGHKSATNALVASDLPAGVGRRFERAWFVDKTGSVDANLAFDFTDAGLSAPATSISGYRLLYSPTNNFESAESAFQVLGLTPTVNGDTIAFTVPDGQLQDGYYTLGFDAPSVVYVDDAWAGFTDNTLIADGDAGVAGAQEAAIGYNAFASVSAAIAAVGSSGTIIVNDGTYAESASLNNGKLLRLTGTGSGNSTVTIHTLNASAATTIDLGSNTLQVGAGNAVNDIAATLQGAGVLTKQGTGPLELRANNSYSGGTNLTGGSTRIWHASSFGTGTINVSAGTYVMLWFNTGSSTISNNWVLNGLNGADGKSAIYGDGGGAGYSTYTLAGNITLNATSNIGGHNTNNVLITGQISGNGGLEKGNSRPDENSTLTLANPANNYAGPTTVKQGTLATSANEVIPNASIVTVNPGRTLNLGSFAETIGGLSGSGNVVKAAGATAPLTINNSADAGFAGVISGGGGLVKLGSGLQGLGGASTYTGDTVVTAGTLKLLSSTAIPDGPGKGALIVNGTLDMGEFNETVNSLSGSGTITTSTSTHLVASSFNSDAASGIGLGKNYTHLLDFVGDGGAAIVNGVQFTAAGLTGGNWSLTSPTAIATFGEGNGGVLPTQLDDLGLERLYRDFYYNGRPGTLTLSGLTPGVTYETRLYNRSWGVGNNRTQIITFDHDGAGPQSEAINFNPDTSATPNFLPYRFTAASSTLTVTFTPNNPEPGSYHIYGVSNEVYNSTPTLTVGDATSTTFAGSISGAASLVKQGTGTLTLSGSNSFTGSLTVNGGILRPTTTAAIPTDITVNAGGTFDTNGLNFNSNRNVTIAGAGAAGTQGALTNTSNSGEGWIRSLTLSGDATIGTSNAKLNVGNAINGNGHTLTVRGGGETNFRLTNAFSNLPEIVVGTSGGGRLRLESSQSPASPMTITVNPGSRLDSYDTRTYGANLALNLNGGILEANGPANSQTASWHGPISVSGAVTVVANDRIDFFGAVSGTGTITKTGGDVLNFRGGVSGLAGLNINAGRVRFENTGFGSWAGQITINPAGTLSHYGNGSTNAAITLAGGTLGVENNGTVAYNGGLSVSQASTIDTTAGNVTLSGGLTGTGNLTKVGGGTITINGDGSGYTGTVNANGGGALVVEGSLGGSVNVGSGTLLRGTATIAGAVNVAAGGAINAGPFGPGTLSAGSLTVDGSFVADVDAAAHDRTVVTGPVDVTDSMFVLNISGVPHAANSVFVLIQKSGDEPITGTFAGLPEGEEIILSGHVYRVTYTYNAEAGEYDTGNDFALLRNRDLTAVDDEFTVLQNTSFDGVVSGNDNDPEGDGSYSLATPAANGTVVITDPLTGAFTYTPDPDFIGTDTFEYRLADDDFESIGLVTITVTNALVTDGVLVVSGSSSSDRVILSATSTPGRISMRFNDRLSYWTDVTESIVVFGQDGDDTITVSGNTGAHVEFYGGAGDDYLAGGQYNDILDGGDGSDRLLAGSGDDQLYGGAGNDTLSGGQGRDLLDGDRAFVVLGGMTLGDLELPAIEDQGRDTLNGEGGVDVLFGHGKGDALHGGGGDNLMIGGDGVDSLGGGAGQDLLYAGDLVSSDNLTLDGIAELWFDGAYEAAIDAISANSVDDFNNDTLNGAGDADWYLLYALDRITTTTEKKGPNVSIDL